MPTEDGGVAYMATQMLLALVAAGLEVDAFASGPPRDVPSRLRGVSGLHVVARDPGWRYDRWYSNAALSKLVTGQLARARAQDMLLKEVAARHAEAPYAALYQFSQAELFAVRRLRDRLPPVIVHPETHAAGELRWHLRERRLARAAGEPIAKIAAVIAIFAARAARQRRDLRSVDRLVAPSHAFARHVHRDYGVGWDRIVVVPNIVDDERFRAREPQAAQPDGPVELLFVARLSARKGVEMVVELSHRLADLREAVRISVVGGPSLWSDYQPLLAGLNADVATFAGGLAPDELVARYHRAGGLLQPSRYEPFGLTVGEALACGVPVVVSDEVGAGEGLDGRCCRRFASGDMPAFERAVRALVAELRAGRGPELARVSAGEARRRFAPAVVGPQVADVVAGVAS